MPQKITFYFTDLSLIAVAIIWALNFTVIKASLSEIDPYTFNSLRFILAASLIWMIVARRGSWFTIQRQDYVPLILLGLIGNLLYQWLFIIGINFTLASNTAVLLGTIPIWVAIFAHYFKAELLNKIAISGIILAFSGVVAIIGGGDHPIEISSSQFFGDLLIVTAAVAWGFYTVQSKRFLSRYTSLQFSAMMVTIGAILLSIIAIPQLIETQWRHISLAAYGGAFYSGSLSIGLAYLIWNNGLVKVGAVRTAAYQNLVPVLGLIFGILLLEERLNTMQLGGSILVIAGIIFTRFSHYSFLRNK